MFFGRDEERALIISNLRASRLTLLYAESGVGKSSLLRAGVAARLRTLAQRSVAERGSPGYLPVVFSSWRDEPTDELVSEVRAAIRPFNAGALPEFPHEPLHEVIQSAAAAADATLLVILDQFEEYLLYSSGETRARRFADELAASINRGDLRANFLIAVREDAYASLGDLFGGKVGNLYGNYLHLEYLDRRAARDAIVRPIERFNAEHPGNSPVQIEPALVDAVLDQVQTGQVAFEHEGRGALTSGNGATRERDQVETPYLQLVMSALWEHEHQEGSKSLRLATLIELGGAEQIVRSHLDKAMRDLSDEERETAIEVFDHLVTPGGTKIAHTISDLAGYSKRDPEQVQTLIGHLTSGDQRILRPVPAAPGDEGRPRVEIFHDVLAPAILSWRSTQTAVRLEREKQAAEAAATHERRRAQLFRAVALAAGALLVVAIVLAVLARRETSRAKRAQSRAVLAQHVALSRELAAAALPYLQAGPVDRGALLSLEAFRYAETSAARASLVEAAQATAPMIAYLGGHTADVTGIAVSPNGKLIASVGADNTLLIQDAATGRIKHAFHGRSQLWSVAFSPDGTEVVAGSDDGAVVLRSVTGRLLATLRADSQPVYAVAFSPDGNMLASGGADHSVVLWNVRSGQRVRVLQDRRATVNTVAFSPDRATLASGDDDGRVIVWRLDTGQAAQTFRRDGSAVNSVAFAPDGQTLASGNDNSFVTLWNPSTGRRLIDLQGQTAAVYSVAYSPDGSMVAAAGDDRTVTLWQPTTGRRLRTFSGQFAAIESVAFGPTGGVLASGGDDDHVIVWRTQPVLTERVVSERSMVTSLAFSPEGAVIAAGAGGRVTLRSATTGQLLRTLAGTDGVVEHVAFSPDGRTLALANADSTVTLWNSATGARLRTLRGHTDIVYTVAFSPDGHTLASAGADQTVIVWNAKTGARERTLRGHTDSVNSVAFSPDGRTLASASSDESVILWDARSGRRLRTLTGATAPVESVAFSPDGRLLAAGGDDRTVILWNAQTGQPLGDPLSGATGSILSVAFSPNGKLLASAGEGASAIVWDLTSRLGLAIPGHTAPIEGVAFSPSGHTLATASLDRTVQLTGPLPPSVPFGTVWSRLCHVVNRSLSRSEWYELVPDAPYRRTCP